jgi:hypothetical protein
MEDSVGSFLGKDKSCIILRSEESSDLGTVPSGDVRKGPIKNSSLEREKGPEYRRNDSSLWIWTVHGQGKQGLNYDWEGCR